MMFGETEASTGPAPTVLLAKSILKLDTHHTRPAVLDAYFGTEGVPSETAAMLRDANAARNEFIACLRSNATDTILACGERHLGFMMRLMSTESVLDFNETRRSIIHRQIKFTWGSVLDKRARSGTWTKAGAYMDVLFTLAAMGAAHFNAAHAMAESDPVGAYKHTREASGVFTAAASIAKSHLRFIETDKLVPMELRTSVLEGMADLALAQSQQLMLWNAEKSKKRPALLAKLAKGTAQLYHQAINHFRAGQGPNMDPLIMETMGAMEDTCNAIVHKYMAQQATADSAYGLAVWHSRTARDKITSVMRHSLTCDSLKSAIKAEAINIGAEAKTASSDNDTVYFDVVPKDNEVAPVVGPIMAKPIPFETRKEWRDIVGVPEDTAPPPPPESKASEAGASKVEEGVVVAKYPQPPAGKTEMRFACSSCSNVIVCAVGTLSIKCKHCNKTNVCIACGSCGCVFSTLFVNTNRVKCPRCMRVNMLPNDAS